MKRYENCMSVLDTRSVDLFDDAEDAWFWFCFCESMPKSSCKGSGLMVRPCETSDIAIIVKRLLQNKKLTQAHLKILSMYGLKQLIPLEKCGDPALHCLLWKQAISVMSKAFEEKGLIRKMSTSIAV